jgi:hypothetical protein
MRSASVLPRSVEQRPADGDLPLRGRGDGGERAHGEVQRVCVRAGHALIRDGDHDALAVRAVRDVDLSEAPNPVFEEERGDGHSQGGVGEGGPAKGGPRYRVEGGGGVVRLRSDVVGTVVN